jgi:hypothetical protein
MLLIEVGQKVVPNEYDKKGRGEYGRKTNLKARANEYDNNRLDANFIGANKQFSIKEHVKNSNLY